MFNKLKEAIHNQGTDRVVEKIIPAVQTRFHELTNVLPPAIVFDDERYQEKVVDVLKHSVLILLSGADNLVPCFNERFSFALLLLREELVRQSGNQVCLVDDFNEQFSVVFKSGFDLAIAA